MRAISGFSSAVRDVDLGGSTTGDGRSEGFEELATRSYQTAVSLAASRIETSVTKPIVNEGRTERPLSIPREAYNIMATAYAST